MNPIKPKLMLDQRKEKRNKVLMFIFAAAFFLIAFMTQGQTEKLVKVTEYSAIKSKYVSVIRPLYGKKFASPTGNKDTIVLSILAEDIGNKNSELSIWVEYPIATKADSLFPVLSLDFDNGYSCGFTPMYYYPNQRKIQYSISNSAYDLLRDNKFTHIEFGKICQSYCKTPSAYFKDFLLALKNK